MTHGIGTYVPLSKERATPLQAGGNERLNIRLGLGDFGKRLDGNVCPMGRDC